ncbi:MAG: xylulokinase [Victivallales bacterium]|nr:xylulokinase [Victivallales bacterium]
MRDVLLGIDFGTGACKITLTDADGAVLDTASGEYPSSHPHPGWSEQNPSDWWDAMVAALAQLQARPAWKSSHLAALAMDSYTHGAVLLDEHLHVIRPTIIWTDQRSTAECQSLKQHSELIFKTAGQMPTPTWTLPQILWLWNNEPDNMRRVHRISFVKDYIRYLLTGRFATDRIECQGTLFNDMAHDDWSPELLALANIKREWLPDIGDITEIAGHVTAEAARLTGLPEGTPVIMGTSDSAVEDYAAGAVHPGQCIIKLATAGNVNVMTAEAHPHPATLTYAHVVPGMYYTVTATNAAAICQRWFRELCCGEEKAEAVQTGVNVYEIINKQAEQSPPGSNGVMFHPYLSGERSPYWDANLRGSFTGLSMGTTKGDLARALLEGVAYSLKDCHRTIEEMQLPVTEYILIGGGAKSPLWSRIICDLFQASTTVPSSCDASFGSALLAGVGVGFFPDARQAISTALRIDRTLQPDTSMSAFYERQFKIYRQIHDALAPVYSQINS